jgi:predicted Zn-dependent peptidase
MQKIRSASPHRANSRVGFPIKESLPANYKKTVLPNGIRIVTEEIPQVRSVALGVWLNVGSRDENVRNNGISHFVEHMVFKGTKRFRVSQIARSLESVGGFLNAFTSKEHTCFYARVLDKHVEKAVDVLSDLVQRPLFDPKELEKEKQVVLDELRSLEDDPDELIHDYFDRVTFGDHPLGYPVIGRADTIPTFDRAMLFEHLRRHYRRGTMVVAAAGNIRHDSLTDLVKTYFSSEPSHRRNGQQRDSGRLKKKGGKVIEYEKPISQAHVCLGTLGLSAKSRHRYALLVLNTLLGDGMSSRLFQNIREKYGFAYNIYSFANMLSDSGTFGVYIGTDGKSIQNSIELIYKELNKVKSNTVSKAELQRTKEQLKGSTVLSLESMSGRMMRLGSSELLFDDYVPIDSILHHIDEVTRDSIHDVAERLFDESKFSTVIFKPVDKVMASKAVNE